MIIRDYFEMIGSENDGFGENGWADGYADIDSDHEQLINQLYGVVPNDDLIGYLNEYLSGYELGQWMSENADRIYDKDGNLKEEYSLETMSHYNEAEVLVLARDEMFNK